MTDIRKFIVIYYLIGILFFIVADRPFALTYGNTTDKLDTLVQGLTRTANQPNQPNYRIQNSVYQAMNQNITNGVELSGIVTKVVDGDTLDINGTRIRLALVDTPERGQPGFYEAKKFVESLCLGKNGQLDVDDGQRRGDRYGRELGVVYCDGVNVNEKLISSNLARILTEFCDISEFSNEKWTGFQC